VLIASYVSECQDVKVDFCDEGDRIIIYLGTTSITMMKKSAESLLFGLETLLLAEEMSESEQP